MVILQSDRIARMVENARLISELLIKDEIKTSLRIYPKLKAFAKDFKRNLARLEPKV